MWSGIVCFYENKYATFRSAEFRLQVGDYGFAMFIWRGRNLV
jgi:hypothetical protein